VSASDARLEDAATIELVWRVRRVELAEPPVAWNRELL
jgi:hypothetical protein